MDKFAIGAVLFVIAIGVLFGGFMAIASIHAEMRGYLQEKRGQAALREAEWDRQIIIEEAKAANESATQNAEARIKIERANAEAEVIRAQGVADSNKIIGEGLQGNEDYLRYLWITQAKGKEVIYVPTEAGLPILEAGKRQ